MLDEQDYCMSKGSHMKREYIPFLGRGTLGSGWQRQMELGAFHLVFSSATESALGCDGLLPSVDLTAVDRVRVLDKVGTCSTESSLSWGDDSLQSVRK